MAVIDRSILILTYHRVGKPPAGVRLRGMYTAPFHLSLQIFVLKLFGFKFATLSQAMEQTSGRWVVMTFDDGYQDNLLKAAPVLKRHRVHGTVFVLTADVGKVQHQWEEAGEWAKADLMDWQELRQLRDLGWEIGSHCHQHVHLTRHPVEERRSLLQQSRDIVKRELGVVPQTLAYPFGDVDKATRDIAQSLGFKYAVATERGEVGSHADHLALRRMAMRGHRFYHVVSFLWNLCTQRRSYIVR